MFYTHSKKNFCFYPIPKLQILDSSKFKEFADDNFKCDGNGSKFSKSVENTVGKGEIAHYEQFLLFPQSFQKASFPEASEGVVVWEWVKLHIVCKCFELGSLKICPLQQDSFLFYGYPLFRLVIVRKQPVAWKEYWAQYQFKKTPGKHG